MHRNKALQQLWNKHGEAAFEYSVMTTLDYEHPQDVTKEDLSELLELCLGEMPGALKL